MTFIENLRKRLRRLARELAKFGSVGAIAFVITFAFFNLFCHLGLGDVKANSAATVIAAVFAYYANRYWTFQGKATDNMRREFVLFFALNAFGLVITGAFVGFNKYVLDQGDSLIWKNVALVIGTGVATVFRFYAYKRWVFRHPAKRTPRPPAGQPAQAGRAAGRSRPHLRRYRYEVMAARTVSLEELFS
ncbi:hypothetical protein GCM10027589_40570 [Actinocorallia lasiicapitis]